MALIKPRELLGHPYSPLYHNVTGNGKRDGLKNSGIGQSAAELPGDRLKVQRLGRLAFNKGEIPTSAGQCFTCKYTPSRQKAAQENIEDIVPSAWKHAGARDKHPGRKENGNFRIW